MLDFCSLLRAKHYHGFGKINKRTSKQLSRCRLLVLFTPADFNTNETVTSAVKIGDNAQVVESDSFQQIDTHFRPTPGNSTNSDFRNFVNHPLKLSHFTWTAASVTTTVSTDLFKDYLALANSNQLGPKLSNFSYAHATLKLKAVIQGQPFAGGQIVLTAEPSVYLTGYATSTHDLLGSSKVNAKILPHIVIDPSKTATYELDLPICTPTGFWSMKDTNYGSYRLTIHNFNTLISGTATVPTVGICIYMSLQDPVLEGLTLLSSAFDGEKKEGGMLSTLVRTAGKMGPLAAAVVPEFSPAISLFSAVSGPLGDFLQWMGFAKPPIVDVTLVPLTRVVDNYSQYDGRSTAIVLGASQTQSLALNPAVGGGKIEEMELSKLVAIPGLFRTFNIAPADPVGAVIATLPVTPTLVQANGLGATYLDPTPIAGVTYPFQFWSGDITIRFEIIATVFHRCTILVAWDPIRGSAPNLDEAVQTLQNTTISISGNVTTDITIPWKKPYPWGNVGPISATSVVGTFPNSMCNGEFHVYIVNPLTSNGSTDSLRVNLYMFSNNLALAAPLPKRISTIKYHAYTETPPAPLLMLGEEEEEFYEEQAPIQYSHSLEATEMEEIPDITLLSADFVSNAEFSPASQISFGPKTDFSAWHSRTMGESYKSVKDITSKCSPSLNQTVGITNASTTTFIGMRTINAPLVVTSVDYDDGDYTNTLFSYFAAAYLGYRGSVRFNFHSYDGQAPLSGSVLKPHMWAAHYADSTVTFPSGIVMITNIDAPYECSTSYAYTAGNRAIGPCLDYTAPSLLPFDFFPTRHRYTLYKDVCQYNVGVFKPAAVETHWIKTLLNQGTGDDGAFVWFMGFPTIFTG